MAPEWIDPLLFSLKLGSLTALFSTLLALPLAFALFRYRFRGRDALVALTLGPLMLPTLVTGVGLLQLFQYVGWREHIGFTALLVGHVVICMPFAVRTVGISLHTLPPNVELAAASLGATRWRTLRHIVFPLIKSGVVAGAVFAFIHSFTDVNLSHFPRSAGRNTDHGQDPGLSRVRFCADPGRRVGDHAAAAAGPGRDCRAGQRSWRLHLRRS